LVGLDSAELMCGVYYENDIAAWVECHLEVKRTEEPNSLEVMSAHII
jgi:hypothetical protein